MLAKFLQPFLTFLKSLWPCNVITQQCANGTPVVSRCDGTIPFLTGCVPELQLNVHLPTTIQQGHILGSKFYSYRSSSIYSELVGNVS